MDDIYLNSSLTVIITFLICVFSYYIIFNNYSLIKSKIDGNKYYVQKKESLTDMSETSDHIAKIVNRVKSLIEHLKKTYPDDPRTKILDKNFDPTSVLEAPIVKGQTSYSINKGEKIMLCLRTRDEDEELIELNTMMFVTLHEIAHVCTVSVGHTEEFWENFKWVLEEAINIGIYSKQEFSKNPVKYCGMTITNSPIET
jgi:hypothetical protein